jgi:hypothetical protein
VSATKAWCFLLFVVILPPCPAWGVETIWSVELSKPAAPQQGLWERQGKVFAGSFLHADEAQRLAETLSGTPVQISPPTPDAWRPWRDRLTLASLGWEQPVVLQGTLPFATIRFPWLEGSRLQGSRLVFHFTFPSGLHPQSRIEIWAQGVPLASMPIKGESMTLEAPLDALETLTLGEEILVEARGEMLRTGDRCADATTNSIWVRIEPSSFLELSRIAPPSTIHGALREAAIKGGRLIQRHSAPEHLEAACRVATALGQMAWRDDALELSDFPGLTPSVVVGDALQDLLWTGTTLYATPQGAALLASSWANALVSPSARVPEAPSSPDTTAPTISFAALGKNAISVQGIGDLIAPIPFTIAQLGAWPKTLVAGISFAHSAVPADDIALVVVRLNGRVLESQQLQGAGSRRLLRVEIPGRLLQPSNTLEVVFRYTSPQGNCETSRALFQATLWEDSFLEIHGTENRLPVSLATFSARSRGQGALVTSKSHAQQTPNLLQLCFALARHRSEPLLLHLTPPGPNLPDGDFLITDDLSLPGLQPLILPLQPLEIRNPLTGAALARFTPGHPLAVLQTFRDPAGRPVLAVSGPPLMPPRLAALLPTAGGANVLLSQGKAWHLVEVGEKFQVVQPATRDLVWYLQQYRMAIFLGLGVLVLIPLIFLYRRAGQRI